MTSISNTPLALESFGAGHGKERRNDACKVNNFRLKLQHALDSLVVEQNMPRLKETNKQINKHKRMNTRNIFFCFCELTVHEIGSKNYRQSEKS